MTKFIKSLLLTVSCLCAVMSVAARNYVPQFRHYTMKDGLMSNVVHDIYQDGRDFIWIGTDNGVCLFNGTEFRSYKSGQNGLVGKHVYEIGGDGKETVFLKTDQALFAYSIRQDSFKLVYPKSASFSYANGRMVIGESNRNLYCLENDSIRLLYQLPKGCVITTLCQYGETILIGTAKNGLYVLEGEKKLSNPISEGLVCDIFRDSSGRCWIGFKDGRGLYVFENGEMKKLRRRPDDPFSLSSSYVQSLCEDANGNIWVGTINGLNKLDVSTRKFARYYKSFIGLTSSSIHSLLCDRQGTMWVGTYYGGINYFNPNEQAYYKYDVSPYETEGLSGGVVGSIAEDKQQHLWIGIDGDGLCRYDLRARTFKWYKHSDKVNSLSRNNVKAVRYDAANDVLWIGTHLGGLNKLDLKTGRFQNYQHQKYDPHSLPSDIVEDIELRDGKLVLAIPSGLTLFDPATGICRSLMDDKEHRARTRYSKDLELDGKGRLWFTRLNKGVGRYDFASGVVTYYRYNPDNPNSLSGDNVNHIYKDSKGNMWFGMDGTGLDVYLQEGDRFKNFNHEKDGLAGNTVYAVCELSADSLLVTTDKGMSVFDVASGRFTNYQSKQAFPRFPVNKKSLFKASNGEVFVGGMEGMLSFFPSNMERDSVSYRIFPYRLTVNGTEINAGDSTKILTEELTYARQILLPPSCTTFALNYTTTDYLSPYPNKLFYQLKGFSDVWMDMQGKNSVTFTNLSPGTYELTVKVSDMPEELVPPSRLIIRIQPPFWKTGWAYAGYLLVIGVAIGYVVRSYKRRIKLQESVKYEQKHAEDIEQMNQAKLRFFINISHEFRTPLTIIITQVETLLQSGIKDAKVSRSVRRIHKSCLLLRSLITELLDFRKMEQGGVRLKVGEHNLVKDVYNSFCLYQDYAAQKHITYKFLKSVDEINVWYDAKQLPKVVNNLIYNAMKYVYIMGGVNQGQVAVLVKKYEREAVIEVMDNGVGIRKEDLPHIFQRFYQADSASVNEGTGIGLSLAKGIIDLHHGTIEVHSEPGVETIFSVHLKLGNEHFKPEELVTDETEPEEKDNVLANIPEMETVETQRGNETEREYPSAEDNESNVSRNQILIVEDNELLCDTLAELFKPHYRVSIVGNGQEGWEKVQQEKPACVVSDIVMPGMSGLELCKAIKQDSSLCHIPVVLLTAKTDREHQLEGLKMGADDYIEKPFDAELLLSRCNNLINNRILIQGKITGQVQMENRKAMATNIVDQKFMDKAIKIVGDHLYSAGFGADDFAREMGVSRTKLFTKLKEITGDTPADFIQSLRLNAAAKMLREDMELNVSEISDRLGFSSPKYFRKCFKDKFRQTPMEFRKGMPDSSDAEGNKENI